MLLKTLTEAFGVSGQEQEVAAILREQVSPYCDKVETDALGNLIAIKNGNEKGPKVMLSAHMDEIGLMVMYIENSGTLRFKPIGGVDPRVLVSKSVYVGKDRVPGVIGAKPIHLQKREEADKPFDIDGLFIDIGAKDKDEAEKLVKPGDGIIFATKYQDIGTSRAKAKAFDDRVGCAVLARLLMMDKQWNFTLQGVFTAQEEVGGRGAQVASYSLEPDIAIAFEGTTASDVPGSKEHLYSTSLGKGPALTHADASFVADPRIVKRLMEVADKNGIPYQMRELTTGGTDAGRIHLVREGIPAVVVSVPTRYIHSPASIIDKCDFENAIKLMAAFLDSIEERGLPF
ncbi:MAG: M42 family metallopeptidase [Firmicutes bacterium]|nr:M42 family metallopeptidase [Bacillota bacterium]HXL04715.1 M42 family metallopeptidase [Bacillota bacterium]